MEFSTASLTPQTSSQKLSGKELCDTIKDIAKADGGLSALRVVCGLMSQVLKNDTCPCCLRGKKGKGNYRIIRAYDGMWRPFCSKKDCLFNKAHSIIDVAVAALGVDLWEAVYRLAVHYGVRYDRPKWRKKLSPAVVKAIKHAVVPVESLPPMKAIASADECDRVLSALLDALFIQNTFPSGPGPKHPIIDSLHRKDLLERGLPWDYVVARKMRSLSNAGKLESAIGAAKAAGDWENCPGIQWLEDQIISGSPILRDALLVPALDLDGLMVRLRIRRYGKLPDGASKYIWASEGNYDSGVAVCHVPRADLLGVEKPYHTIRITEGELKADVATTLSGILTIGVPGTSCWRTAISVIDALHPERLLLAFDMDILHNDSVRNDLIAMCDHFKAAGHQVELEEWMEAFKADPKCKGIDDFLLKQNQAKGVDR